jgi:hypothetical protein
MTSTGVKTYRPFLLEDGEALLLSLDAVEHTLRFAEFLETTGLTPTAVVSEALVGVPLPIYETGKRFSDVNPEALWNPLFWLPEDIALRFRIKETPDGEPRVETDVEWATRIAFELTKSGLYDPEQGWLDVFALYGIDTSNPEDIAAITNWQFFLPEERLDRIDIRDHVTFSEDNGAFFDSQELLPFLLPAQWAHTAASILAVIEADQNNVGGYAELAAGLLDTIPGDEPDTLYDAALSIKDGGDLADFGPTIVEALEAVLEQYADGPALLNEYIEA